MRGAYKVVAHLIALGVLLQAAFVALGWFQVMKDLDDGKTLSEGWDYNIGQNLHAVLGMIVMPLLGLALLVVAFFAAVPGGVRWAGLTLLAIVVQVVLALIAFGVPAVGVLHGLGAFAVLGLAEFSARRATGGDDTASATAATAAV